MWEFIDKIVYINLDHREDRRAIMRDFFEKGNIPPDKIIRFPAIKDNKGYIGCLKSHTAALQMAKDNAWENVLILEDDLEWLDIEPAYKQLEELLTLPRWDVIQLVGWYYKHDLPRLHYTLNAGAYLVNSSYYDTLLANRYNAIRKVTGVERLFTKPDMFTADTSWNTLLKQDYWYGLYPCICRQVNTYSDNSGRVYEADQVYGLFNEEVYLKIYGRKQNAQQENSENRK